MDIIHGLSINGQEEVEDADIKRNWNELPSDVMSLILLKLGAVYILISAQWVCYSWWKLSKQPHIFRSIHVETVIKIFGRPTGDLPYSTIKFSEGLAREAIDRSCGQLVEFSANNISSDKLIRYMSEKSSFLRRLQLWKNEHYVTDVGLIEIAKKLPHLEELEIIQRCSEFSKNVFETFGRFCPHLKSCCIVDLGYNPPVIPPVIAFDGVALAIAENMPGLRHLNLFGNSLTDDYLSAILDGCPHLEALDLGQCFDLNFGGDLKERCGNINVLRLPNGHDFGC